MESYLKGRGYKEPIESEESKFQGFLEGKNSSDETEKKDDSVQIPQEKEVIYEKEGCPKVEVISEDGCPTTIVIHLPDGRLLEIDCQY